MESVRHIQHYKQKYTEYKNKMKKANQNIAILMARVAKYDLQMQSDKEGAVIRHSPPGWAGD